MRRHIHVVHAMRGKSVRFATRSVEGLKPNASSGTEEVRKKKERRGPGGEKEEERGRV